MNLHGLASQAISAVNPMISATLQTNAGYTTADDGTRTPILTDSSISIQFQAFSERELTHINELNIGGIIRKIYANGTLQAMDHKAGKGGDLLTIASNTWLVVHVMEQWPDWCSVVAQKQVD